VGRFLAAATAGHYAAGAIATGLSIVVSAIVTYVSGIPGIYAALVFFGLALALTGLALMLVRFFMHVPVIPRDSPVEFVPYRDDALLRQDPRTIPTRRKRSIARDETYVKGENILLPEISKGWGNIEGLTFEDCDLYGPAVLEIGQNVQITEPTFDVVNASLPGILWNRDELVPPTDQWGIRRALPLGVIHLSDCRFVRCRFHALSVVADMATYHQLSTAFGAAFEPVS
jgi:hypothetical protein